MLGILKLISSSRFVIINKDPIVKGDSSMNPSLFSASLCKKINSSQAQSVSLDNDYIGYILGDTSQDGDALRQAIMVNNALRAETRIAQKEWLAESKAEQDLRKDTTIMEIAKG